jgi:hypothetical protein
MTSRTKNNVVLSKETLQRAVLLTMAPAGSPGLFVRSRGLHGRTIGLRSRDVRGRVRVWFKSYQSKAIQNISGFLGPLFPQEKSYL